MEGLLERGVLWAQETVEVGSGGSEAGPGSKGRQGGMPRETSALGEEGDEPCHEHSREESA